MSRAAADPPKRVGAPDATGDALAELRRAWMELLGAERRLRSRDVVADDGLNFTQIRALAQLKDEPVTAGQLARQAEVNPATITAMLDQLEAAGVVRRHRSTSDRRVVLVSLTPAGRAVLDVRRERWEALWAETFATTSDAELASATAVVRRIVALLDGLGLD